MKINLPTFAAQVFAAFCGLSAVAFAAQASPPSPDAMATQPDPRDFVTRADTQLSALGNPMRFGGMNISWLGLRDDTGRLEDAHLPTEFEVKDAFDTVQAGARRTVQFTNVLVLTYNATSLILPGLANITTSGGDVAEFVSLGSGNWVCTSYQRASGQAVVATSDNFSSNFYQVREQQPSGTVGATTYSASSWVKVSLNTEITSRPGWVSAFSSSQITLVAGTYDVRSLVVIPQTGGASPGRIRLRDVTGASTLLLSVSTNMSITNASTGDSIPQIMQGRITLPATHVIEIDGWTDSANNQSPQPASTGDIEIYADLEFIKVT